MDAVELLKTFHRFCESKESCSECELISNNNSPIDTCENGYAVFSRLRVRKS